MSIYISELLEVDVLVIMVERVMLSIVLKQDCKHNWWL